MTAIEKPVNFQCKTTAPITLPPPPPSTVATTRPPPVTSIYEGM